MSLRAAAGTSMVVVALVMVFLALRAWPTVEHIGLDHFFGGTTWDPEGAYHDAPLYGAWTPILGSITAVLLALVIAVPVGVALAIVLAETNRRTGDRVMRPAIELFVGVPSIVYGYLGLILLVPRLGAFAPPGRSGQGFGAAAIVLGLMIVPTVATLAADAIQSVPAGVKEASYALGATQWQTIWRALLPAARQGLITGVVLGFARAMGEALAVAMVIGNTPSMPDLTKGTGVLFQPGMTMTTTITDGITELGLFPKAEAARYALAIVLLLISFACVTVVRSVQHRSEARS